MYSGQIEREFRVADTERKMLIEKRLRHQMSSTSGTSESQIAIRQFGPTSMWQRLRRPTAAPSSSRTAASQLMAHIASQDPARLFERNQAAP